MKNSLSEKWYMNHKLTVDLYYPDSNSSEIGRAHV